MTRVGGADVSRETMAKLEQFAELLRRESERQNLVSAVSIEILWERHIVDSAQILPLAPSNARFWLDVGSGAGLPGVVLAIMTDATHWLVEPRRLRAQFLQYVADTLGLSERVQVNAQKIASIPPRAVSVITARAFASLSKTLAATHRFADEDTHWLLHKGRSVDAELAEAQRLWEGDFERITSMTEPSAAIVRVRRVRPRRGT